LDCHIFDCHRHLVSVAIFGVRPERRLHLIFEAAALWGPIYFLLFWRRFIRKMNSNLARIDETRSPSMMAPVKIYVSMQWGALFALVGSVVFAVVVALAIEFS
jgi:hypothetical protein